MLISVVCHKKLLAHQACPSGNWWSKDTSPTSHSTSPGLWTALLSCPGWTAIFFTKPWENFLDSFDMWMARQCSTFRCEQPGQAMACQHMLQINKVLVTVIFFQGEFPVGRNWPGWSKRHIVKRFEWRPEEETVCGHGTYWRPKGRHLVLLYAWVKRIFDWVSVKPKPV